MTPLKTILSLLCLLWLLPAQAQVDIPKKDLASKITKATVFLNGAQVQREGKTTIPSGTTDLVIKKLPAQLDPTSIQVQGDGEFTIMAVTPSLNRPPKVEFVVDQDKIDALALLQKKLQRHLNHVQTDMQALNEEERLLTESRTKITSHPEGGLSVEDIDKAAALYRRRFTEINESQWQNSQQQLNIQASVDSITKVINKIRTPVPIEKIQEKPSYSLTVTVSAKRSVPNARLDIKYLVPAAGWLPSYDIRIEEVGKPVYLGFRAQVYQATGEDWRDVKLTLSTGNPSRNSIKPNLNPWYLSYTNSTQPGNQYYADGQRATGPFNPNIRRVTGRVTDQQTGEALIGATIIVQGTTIGTYTDVNGNYEIVIPQGSSAMTINYVGYQSQSLNVSGARMDIRLGAAAQTLDEVVVTGLSGRVAGVSVTDDYGDRREEIQLGNTLPLVVNRVERATNQIYEIEAPYSLAGDGRRFAVDVEQYELPADYAYASVPKIDGNAYLTARIPDWDAFNLMEGEARLFFEDAYLGKTILDTRTVVDTLSLSLGVDDAVVIERNKIKDESKSQLLGLTRKETRVFEIAIKNTKNQPVRLLIEDQIPMSREKQIDTKLVEAEGARYNEETGILDWDISLQPGESRRLRLEYIVKYPAERSLKLE